MEGINKDWVELVRKGNYEGRDRFVYYGLSYYKIVYARLRLIVDLIWFSIFKELRFWVCLGGIILNRLVFGYVWERLLW